MRRWQRTFLLIEAIMLTLALIVMLSASGASEAASVLLEYRVTQLEKQLADISLEHARLLWILITSLVTAITNLILHIVGMKKR